MSDFKSRLVIEKDELSEKVVKLTTFIESNAFKAIDKSQQNLLEVQLSLMIGYLNVLEMRLNLL